MKEVEGGASEDGGEDDSGPAAVERAGHGQPLHGGRRCGSAGASGEGVGSCAVRGGRRRRSRKVVWFCQLRKAGGRVPSRSEPFVDEKNEVIFLATNPGPACVSAESRLLAATSVQPAACFCVRRPGPKESLPKDFRAPGRTKKQVRTKFGHDRIVSSFGARGG